MDKLTAEDVKRILEAFKPWINQRPNLDPANYGLAKGQTPDRTMWHSNYNAMQSELRNIARQGTRARKALKIALAYEPNPEAMADALTRFSGRLQWRDGEFEYTTGQYYPTEYRLAAAVVLESYSEFCRPKYNPPEGFDPSTIDEIIDANRAAGRHFFDRDTMRCFRSRVLSELYKGPGGIFFITSEQFEDSQGRRAGRRYTVRKFNPKDASISSVGGFNKLTRSAAQGLAGRAALG